MRRYRKLLDDLSQARLRIEPKLRAANDQSIAHDIPGLDIQSTGRNRYRVQVAGMVYDLERAHVEIRPGGRYRRNMIRWLVGYARDILTVFLLGFVEEFDALSVGLHLWLDHFIRRTGVTFVVEWFRLLDFRLGRV